MFIWLYCILGVDFISIYNEEVYEDSILNLLQDLGYTYYSGYDVERDYKNPLFVNDLDNLYSINRDSSRIAIENAIKKVQDFGIASVAEKNERFNNYLQNGISVNYWEDNQEKSTLIKLVDWKNL